MNTTVDGRWDQSSTTCATVASAHVFNDRLLCLRLLSDMFRGRVVDNIALPGLDHVIVVTCIGAAVYFRVYSIVFKKSGTKVVACLSWSVNH